MMLDKSLLGAVFSGMGSGEVCCAMHLGISRCVKVPKSSGANPVFCVSREFSLEFCVWYSERECDRLFSYVV